MDVQTSSIAGETAAAELRAVAAVDVVREYRMGTNTVRALQGVSLAVERGEFVCLLGTSGSGKSTLLNIIAGLDRPTSGSVVVLGRDLARLSSLELAQYRRVTVGVIFQAFNLISSMTVEENVELPMRFAEVARADRPARVHAALERVGLTARMAHRPAELSGGEQQRVAIARALVNRPSLLLADEPTGNLDSRTGEEILELLRDFNRTADTTVLMVTHERALAERYADRLLFLADGKLVGEQRVNEADSHRRGAETQR
jgi:ABC-type lipoprotein export system ATPase subunit